MTLQVLRGDGGGGLTGPPCFWGYGCGDLVLQVGRVSNETVIYGYDMKKQVRQTKGHIKSGHGPQRAAQHEDVQAD
jgi:hypothetical protein